MGYALRPRKKWTKDNPSLGGGAVLPSDAKPSGRIAANGSGRGRRSDRYFRRDVGDVHARRSGSRYRHRPPACAGSIALFLHPLLDRVLDVLDLVDLDVDEAPADFLDATDVDRLDDVASLRIDSDRAARAFPFHALGGRDERLGLGLAAGILQSFVDEV